MDQPYRTCFAAMEPYRSAVRHPDDQRHTLFTSDQRIHHRHHFPEFALTDQSHFLPMSLFGHDTRFWQSNIRENFRKICRGQRWIRTKRETVSQTPPIELRKTEKIHCPGCSPTLVDACMLTLGEAGTETVAGTAGGFLGPNGVAVARSKRAKATL